MIMPLPTRLDRYPAKMVTRLADQLIERYASDATRVLDPFSGSGAVLVAANRKGIPVTGVDVNPIAALFSHVKLRGIDHRRAAQLASNIVSAAKSTKTPFRVSWPLKHYWFTPATLDKFERLRSIIRRYELTASDEGMAVLLSFSLAVRLCSRADQRSPKPFISKGAIESRKGKHFDPYRTCLTLLDELSELYGSVSGRTKSTFLLADLCRDMSIPRKIGKYSHIITSPPYINAQDYFRNFKLELNMLQGLLSFSIEDIRERFVGTERGSLLASVPQSMREECHKLFPRLRLLEKRKPRLDAVVQRYLHDMSLAFDTMAKCLEPGGTLVLVCGDNLIGGMRIRTWQLLKQMLEKRGFRLFDMFSDRIGDRMLAPKRCGHKGLIKEEVVCAFQFG